MPALLAAGGLFGAILVVRFLGVRRGVVYAVLGAAVWVALLESGVEPVIVGLAIGLGGVRLPHGSLRARARHGALPFVPRAADARAARARRARGSRSAVSPNERLQQLFHPWTSYVIVPLFALANAGIAIDLGFLEAGLHVLDYAWTPVGYVAGKPIGILGAVPSLRRWPIRTCACHRNSNRRAGSRRATSSFCEISAAFWGYAGQVLRSFTIEADPTPLYVDLHAAADAAFDGIVAATRPRHPRS